MGPLQTHWEPLCRAAAKHVNFFSRIFFETERGVIYIDDNYCISVKQGVFFVIAHGAVVTQVADFTEGLELIRELKKGDKGE